MFGSFIGIGAKNYSLATKIHARSTIEYNFAVAVGLGFAWAKYLLYLTLLKALMALLELQVDVADYILLLHRLLSV